MILDAAPAVPPAPIEDSETRLVYNDSEEGRRVLTTLLLELRHCRSFRFSVAFITGGGLACLKQQLSNIEEEVSGRIITTDYLDFNDPKTLRELLRFKNIQTRVYTRSGFHTKGYIFDKDEGRTFLTGSSNLTQDALSKNKEWNVWISADADSGAVDAADSEFERMWEESVPLTESWIRDYEPRHIRSGVRLARSIVPAGSGVIVPNVMQEEALQNLSRIRSSGQDRALLISATGTGKTYLSAFDVRESGARRVLFLVHREQILDDAMRSYREILGDGISMGKIAGTRKDFDADFIFSTTISMSKPHIHERFRPDHFDYIVCDEAHHATTKTYDRIMDYFKPGFFLGMTATPERMDGGDVFSRFNHNIAYEIRLQDALKREMLCPFHYYGVSEISVDGKLLDEDSDFNSLVADERVKHIMEKAEYYGYSGDRVKGLIFCRNKQEGRTLSEKLNGRGLKTRFVCDEDRAEAREDAVCRLEGGSGEDRLDYILTVDIFNEGVDIKSVNQIIMLRPTESATVFIQQLGRGLRRMTRDNQTKEYLVVIDFIGNYRNNFLIPVALTGDSSMSKESWKRHLMSGDGIPGCSTVDFDTVTKERIYESINRATGMSGMMKDAYRALCNTYGYGPSLCQLYQLKKIDPVELIRRYRSLNLFKKVMRCGHREYGENSEMVLDFVSGHLTDGKRPHELLIVESLIRDGSVTVDELSAHLADYGVGTDRETVDSSIRLLEGKFSDGLKGRSLLNVRGCAICASELLLDCLSDPHLKEDIEDAVECGLMKFEQEYRDGFDGGFKLFSRYSRGDVCRLLNWESKKFESTMYGYMVHNGTCPIFVTYNKRGDISMSTRYEDRFIDRGTFSWMTRSRRTLESDEVVKILGDGCRSYLFVKKDDDESSDFFYMGRVRPVLESVRQTTIPDDGGRQLPIVNIPLRLEQPVPQDIYDYIVEG